VKKLQLTALFCVKCNFKKIEIKKKIEIEIFRNKKLISFSVMSFSVVPPAPTLRGNQRQIYRFKKTKPELIVRVYLWYLQESNQGHMDFQSIALPTELRYLFNAGANIG